MIEREAADAATNCTTCARAFLDLTRDGSKSFVCKGEDIVGVICPVCKSDSIIAEYKKTGEIYSSLMMEACSAAFHLDESKDLSRLQRTYADIYSRHAESYREINAAVNEISDQARLAEIAVWFGRPDLATDAELARTREESGKFETDYKIENGPDSVQTYYANTKDRGHAYRHEDFTALLWGCAGRVMITLSDSRKFGDKAAKYGGATISLIYDEDCTRPRGGIQCVAGTKAELLGLIQAMRTNVPKFAPDHDVTIA